VRYIELEFEARLSGERSSLPPFLGPTLRGALGYLLKQTVCQIRGGDCGSCVLQAVCAYPAIFEGIAPQGRKIMRRYDNIPQPFVLLPDGPLVNAADSPTLTWGMRLFGDACRYWPYLVHVYKTAGERGLGSRRIQCQLERVTDRVGNATLWSSEQAQTAQPTAGSIAPENSAVPARCTLRWTFQTPVRIAAVSAGPVGIDLFLAGRRRFQIMDYFYGNSGDESPMPASGRIEADEFTTTACTLEPWRLQRYSGRQHRRMTLDGLIGEITIEGPWGKTGPWLHAVPLIHLGKATSFGFGRVKWEVL
jgi:hypothetical protein